ESRIKDMSYLLDQGLAQTRNISYLLHPPMLEDVGLMPAVKWLAERFSKRSGIQVVAELPDKRARLPRDVELAAFRIIQEAPTNIEKHSNSKNAIVQLTVSAHDLQVAVIDHGTGISADATNRPGVGLFGMKERVRNLSGNLDIDSSSAGTTVSV